MDCALVLSGTEKDTIFFTDILNTASIGKIVSLSSCSEARRRLIERDFDLIVINAPLNDDSGIGFAQQITLRGASQVILVVKSEHFDAVSAECEDYGVLTIPKPIDKAYFWAALKLATAAQNRLRRIRDENNKLKQKVEDIKIVNRAKCMLISYHNMSEQDAHRCIEKQAMDMRTTRRAVAEKILETYD